jgi:hypothetical protein
MAEIEVINWQKVMTMRKAEIIRFQLMVHCYVEKVPNISPALLDCMTLLGQKGTTGLISFCEMLADKGIFQSAQSGRNAIDRLQDRKLVVKGVSKIDGKNKKVISLNPDLKIQNSGNVLVDIRCFSPNKEIEK